MLDFFCDIMECLLTVPSAKCDQIENESGPFSYRKADCNTTFPVRISKKGSKLGVYESRKLGKTSKINTGDFLNLPQKRYGKNLAMRANIMTRGFDLPELLFTKVLPVMLPNFSDDEASCRNNAWNCT